MELAEDAVAPEHLAQLMRHVAKGLDSHAQWVGTAAHEAAQERCYWRASSAFEHVYDAANRAVISKQAAHVNRNDLPSESSVRGVG